MSHPLTGKHAVPATCHRARAVVSVARKGNDLVVEPGVQVAPSHTAFFKIKGHGLRVIDREGNEIKPSAEFWISAETIDPYHLVTDWDGNT